MEGSLIYQIVWGLKSLVLFHLSQIRNMFRFDKSSVQSYLVLFAYDLHGK
jgi:hypothetical protein